MPIFGQMEKRRNEFMKKADMNWWRSERLAGLFWKRINGRIGGVDKKEVYKRYVTKTTSDKRDIF